VNSIFQVAAEGPAVVLTAQATIAAAIATLLSAIFIAVQAWYTRKSVKETKSALDIAQAEFERNSLIFVDAQKARIDAEMPKLSVDGIESGSVTLGPASSQNLLSAGSTVDASKDLSEVLALVIRLSISNEGFRRAPLRGYQRESAIEVPALAHPGGLTTPLVIIELPLEEWIAIAMQALKVPEDEMPPLETVDFVYEFPGDVGADEIHTVEIRGSILEPVGVDSWQIREISDESASSIQVRALPFVREYWISRRANRKL
jgi:hypothetical protein